MFVKMFPSPYGAWVVSLSCLLYVIWTCFRPLTGHGLYRSDRASDTDTCWFPSPYGAWVVSLYIYEVISDNSFPSPYGAWVVSGNCAAKQPMTSTFPSPYGAWVVSRRNRSSIRTGKFPSPYGAWVVSAKPDTNRFTDDGILVDNNVVKTTMSSYHRYRRVNYSMSRTKCQ